MPNTIFHEYTGESAIDGSYLAAILVEFIELWFKRFDCIAVHNFRGKSVPIFDNPIREEITRDIECKTLANNFVSIIPGHSVCI